MPTNLFTQPALFLIAVAAFELDRVVQLAEAGLDAVILRRPELEEREYLSLAEHMLERLPSNCRLVTHTYAMACANGLHLPEGFLGSLIVAPNALLGRSVHSVAAAQNAQSEGCDYVFFGNVWETDTHPGLAGAGLARLAEVCAAVTIPVVAIGGVTPSRAAECIRAGAKGVAAVSALRTTEDVLAFRNALANWSGT